ncbi:XRE family transcriptional regulator [Phenylobacterium sp.]|uniref:XRE family transcriptional regulator n=1 Tax=Phenylobacterium sp. TaxID=1871053 RepID=UPI00286C7011|nr:XRE family transcriptional regulator [Phenylobacterium sp.]
MQRTALAMPPTLSPRGLQRAAAAGYVGISTSKFDEMVEDGRMPRPKVIDRRKVWDRNALDIAFDDLPDDGDAKPANDWD